MMIWNYIAVICQYGNQNKANSFVKQKLFFGNIVHK